MNNIKLETIVKKEGVKANCPREEGKGDYFIGAIQCQEGVPFVVGDSEKVEVKRDYRIGLDNHRGDFRYYNVI